MTAPLRIGLLSTARINHPVVEGARQVEEVEVVAVGSRSQAKAAEHAAALGLDGARTHGSYEALLADPDVDAVYIPLPNGDHAPWSIRAAQAGKHVLCEKPLSRSAAQAAQACDAADAAGVVLAEAFMWRHHPQAAALRGLLAEEAVGTVRAVRAAFSFPLLDPADIRWSAALEGGALMDVGCYCVSGIRYVAGEPLAVSATRVDGGDGVDARMAGWMRLAGDVTATFDCAFDLPARDELEIIGTAGSLFLPDPWHSRASVIEIRRHDTAPERVQAERAQPYACELRDFAAVVCGERSAPFGRDDIVAQAGVIEALYASAAEGRVVAL